MRGRTVMGLAGAASLLLCCALLSSSLLQPCAAGRLAAPLGSQVSPARRSEGLYGLQRSQGRLLHGGIDDGHEEEEPAAPTAAPSDASAEQSTLVANKVGALFVFLAVPLIGCFLPWVLPIPPWLLNYAVLFSAGLFFSLAVEHLLADSAASFHALVDNPYPFAYMIFVSGYFLTWLADITARAVWERQEGVRQQRRVDSAAAGAGAAAGTALAASAAPADATPLTATASGRVVCCKSGRVEDVEEASGEKEAALAEAQGTGDLGRCPGGECKCDGGACRCTAPSFMEFDTPDAIGRAAGTVYDLNFLEVLLLLLALCFHGFFEGLAVGLSTTVADVWSTTSTVVIHKFLEGIALGTTLLAQNPNRSIFMFLLYALGFSIMAPIGIAIGLILGTSTSSLTAAWIEAIGNGLAAGVFVFVAVGHLMVKAMKPQKGDAWWAPFPKWGFAALGVITNSLLMMRTD